MASRSICFQSIASPADGSSIRPRREITPCTLVTSDERSLFFVVIFLSLSFLFLLDSFIVRFRGKPGFWERIGRKEEELMRNRSKSKEVNLIISYVTTKWNNRDILWSFFLAYRKSTSVNLVDSSTILPRRRKIVWEIVEDRARSEFLRSIVHHGRRAGEKLFIYIVYRLYLLKTIYLRVASSLVGVQDETGTTKNRGSEEME